MRVDQWTYVFGVRTIRVFLGRAVDTARSTMLGRTRKDIEGVHPQKIMPRNHKKSNPPRESCFKKIILLIRLLLLQKADDVRTF